jgi:[ribosomal protein S5]-alanine N-acetyltransferase
MIEPATCTLRTPRLRIVIPSVELASEYAAYAQRNRAHLQPWSPARTEDFYTTAFWEEELPHRSERARRDESFEFVLLPADEGDVRILGEVNLTGIRRGIFDNAYLGYNLDREAVGKSLMFEALTAVIPFAFAPEGLALHRLSAAYRPTNERSGALLRRLGFTVEGYARDYLFIDGAWRDHILTALIRCV